MYVHSTLFWEQLVQGPSLTCAPSHFVLRRRQKSQARSGLLRLDVSGAW
jgi:hypothetical protein